MTRRITEAQRIAVFDRLAGIAYEKARTAANPALVAWYSEMGRAYEDVARKLAADYKIGSAPRSRGSTPKGEK